MALEGGEGSASRLGRSLPRERPGTHCTGGWVGPRAGLDRCGKSRPPPGFDPRAVQPVASRYTDYATRPKVFGCWCSNYAWDSFVVYRVRRNFVCYRSAPLWKPCMCDIFALNEFVYEVRNCVFIGFSFIENWFVVHIVWGEGGMLVSLSLIFKWPKDLWICDNFLYIITYNKFIACKYRPTHFIVSMLCVSSVTWFLITSTPYFTQIRPLGAALIHTDRRTDVET
jgi:hypothetical protein